jgi:hypothetical protein
LMLIGLSRSYDTGNKAYSAILLPNKSHQIMTNVGYIEIDKSHFPLTSCNFPLFMNELYPI